MEGEISDWKVLLQTENLETATVACMKHAPGAKNWNGCVVPGIKLVIRHHDASPSRRSLAVKPSFWVVTLMEVKGYFALVRYLGMGRDAVQDFWIHLGKHEIYPIGKESPTAIFMPPTFLLGKAQDWRAYFVTHLPGALTIPDNFVINLYRESSPRTTKYKIGNHLEVLDKYNISQFRVGRVSKIVGKRMYLQYVDEEEDGFFCHEQSSLIHSLGWATCVGHKIKAPAEYLSTDIQASSADEERGNFQEGMKLEAVDPLCPSRICAASICKVLEYGYIMVKMDCYDDENPKIQGSPHRKQSEDTGDSMRTEDSWFCYHVRSAYIFKCGFCKKYGIPLVPPLGYEHKFSWSNYLEESNELVAPLPEKPKFKHEFKASMKLEMVDLMTPSNIHVATVTRVVGRLLRISFDGWEPEYDQWIDAESPDIFPIGWCTLVGHSLQTPKSAPSPNHKIGT